MRLGTPPLELAFEKTGGMNNYLAIHFFYHAIPSSLDIFFETIVRSDHHKRTHDQLPYPHAENHNMAIQILLLFHLHKLKVVRRCRVFHLTSKLQK